MRGIASHSTPRTSCNIQHRLTSRFLSRSSSLTAPWATMGWWVTVDARCLCWSSSLTAAWSTMGWGVTVDVVGLAAIIAIYYCTGWKLIEVRISEFRL